MLDFLHEAENFHHCTGMSIYHAYDKLLAAETYFL